MSTVIFYEGVFYADTQETTGFVDNYTSIDRCSKLQKIGNSIFGFAGHTKILNKFIAWAKSGYPPEGKEFIVKGRYTFRALQYNGDSVTCWKLKELNGLKDLFLAFCGGRVRYRFVVESDLPVDDIMWRAFGSGKEYAAGAIEMEKDPVKCIISASKHDPATNSVVEKLSLDDDEPEIVYYESSVVSKIGMSDFKYDQVGHLI